MRRAASARPRPPSPSSASRETATRAAQPLDGIHKIRHIVVIMQENRSFDSYFGTYPGRGRDPDEERRADGLRPGPVDAELPAAVPRHRRPQRRRAARPHRRGPRHQRRADERVHQAGAPGPAALVRRARGRAHVLARADVARRHGLPRLARDPQLLDVRAPLRAAGPHVRAGPVLEHARAPVHGLGLVGEVLDQGRPDELRRRDPGAGLAAGRAAEHDRRDPRLRVDRPHVSPLQAQRQLALLRGEGGPARLRRQRDVLRAGAAELEDAGDLEPAAVVRHGPQGRAAREHRAAAGPLRRRPQRHAAGGLVDRAGAGRQRAPAGLVSRGAELRHRAHQHDHAEQGLVVDGDLPQLGRLGRLLRPRRAAEGRRPGLRAPRARARDQPVRAAGASSTTRC